MAATMDGTINIGAFQQVNLVVRFFQTEDSTHVEKFKSCAYTDALGDFTVEGIPPGTYDVGVKSDCSVSEVVLGKVFTDGNTTDVDFGTLRRGDLDGDDYVGGGDYSIYSSNFNEVGGCWGWGGDWLLPDDACEPCVGGAVGRGALFRQIGIGVQSQ